MKIVKNNAKNGLKGSIQKWVDIIRYLEEAEMLADLLDIGYKSSSYCGLCYKTMPKGTFYQNCRKCPLAQKLGYNEDDYANGCEKWKPMNELFERFEDLEMEYFNRDYENLPDMKIRERDRKYLLNRAHKILETLEGLDN